MTWYTFKLGRLAFQLRSILAYPNIRKMEGNNRWVHLALGFWWRYDATGPGTMD